MSQFNGCGPTGCVFSFLRCARSKAPSISHKPLMILAVLLVCVGCSQTAQQTSTAKAPDDKPYQFESEGEAPAPTAGEMRRDTDHVDVFEETAITEEAIEVENVVEPVPTAPEPGDSIVVGPGFRVQVFASGTRETAETHRVEAETRLRAKVYVELVDGMYKVRVGDCRTREEAEQLLGRCRGAGFSDAWIVTTDVRWRKPSQSPQGKPEP